MNIGPTPNPRQETLTGMLRCHYDTDERRPLRPHCQGFAIVAYGDIRLCATCDQMRSAVGRTNIARAVPGAELAHLIDAAQAVTRAERQLADAVRAARVAGASWAQIGDAVGLTRQAAQQRWRHPSPNPERARRRPSRQGPHRRQPALAIEPDRCQNPNSTTRKG
jgi:hypothetical protein